MSRKITIHSPSELGVVANAILESLNGRSVVLLNGGMGAGKTTLVRDIAALMGSKDSVTSPTFAIVNEYIVEGGESIYHFDMYRIERIEEAIDLGFEEYMHSGCLCFIEWSERVTQLLPDDVCTVHIDAPSEFVRDFIID